MGDKRLVPDSEPLNVNITFVHRQDPSPHRKVKVVDVADDKKEPTFQNRRVPNIRNTDTKQTPKTLKGSLPPLKNPPGHNRCGPRSNVGTVSKKDVVSSRNRITKNKTLPPLRDISEKIKKSSKPPVALRRKQRKRLEEKSTN